MDAIDVLMEARAYIEKGWCRHTLASGRTNEDERAYLLALYNARPVPKVGRERVNPHKDTARRWCAVGAVTRGAHPLLYAYQHKLGVEALRLLAEAVGIEPAMVQLGSSPHSLEGWNDAFDRTQEEVLEAFDRAIALGIDREMAR